MGGRFPPDYAHGACDGPYQVPECSQIANKNGRVVGPTVLTNLSAEPGENTGVSATDIYDYYRNLWEQRDGWWWKAFGNDSDGFTIWDFLSMMAYYEAGFDTSIATIMAEAGVRFFYERAQTLNTPTTVEYLLDWWAHFSESTARLIKSNARPQLWNSIKNVKKFKVFGDSFRNPPSSWQEGWAYNRPYDWGNAYILSVDTVSRENV